MSPSTVGDAARTSRAASPDPLLRRILVTLALIGAVVGLEFSFDLLVPDAALQQLVLFAMVNVIVALSLNVINGMAGQFSIGHAGFVGLGGYTSAIVASHLHVAFGGGLPTFARSFVVVPICLVASAALAGLFGFFVGLPSLRLKGDYLAIVTLGFAEMFRLVIATAVQSPRKPARSRVPRKPMNANRISIQRNQRAWIGRMKKR